MENERSEKDPLLDAVRRLRLALGDTQQKFAHRLGLAISTVVRYELTRPPKGKALATMQQLAKEHGQPELWEIFRRALREELGLEDYSDDRVSLVIPKANIDAHAGLEEVIGRRQEPAAQRILKALKPYTAKARQARKWSEKAGADESGWSVAGPEGVQIGRKETKK